MTDQDEAELPPVDPQGEPLSVTAGEEYHADPEVFRGEVADAPRDPDEPFDDIPEGES